MAKPSMLSLLWKAVQDAGVPFLVGRKGGALPFFEALAQVWPPSALPPAALRDAVAVRHGSSPQAPRVMLPIVCIRVTERRTQRLRVQEVDIFKFEVGKSYADEDKVFRWGTAVPGAAKPRRQGWVVGYSRAARHPGGTRAGPAAQVFTLALRTWHDTCASHRHCRPSFLSFTASAALVCCSFLQVAATVKKTGAQQGDVRLCGAACAQHECMWAWHALESLQRKCNQALLPCTACRQVV